MGLFSFFKKEKDKVDHTLGPYVEMDETSCDGVDCQKCVAICPNFSFIVQEDKVLLKEYYTCRNCKKCMAACPNNCIKVI